MKDTTPDEPIDQLSERYLDELVELNPVAATFMGIDGHEDRYPDYSPAGYEALIELNRRTVSEAEGTPTPTQREQVAKDALLERLGLELELLDAGIIQHLVNAIASTASEVRQVYDLMPTETEEQWANIAARLGKVAPALDGYRASLTEQAALGRVSAEAAMALIAERKYSKQTILENYLNEIYLGQKGSQGIFGIGEGAQFYFSKPLADLTVGETALLAGLIRAPNRLSPYKSAESATKRRNVVLAKLLDDRIITRKQYDAALKERLPKRLLVKVTNEGPFYVDYLRRELDENYSAAVLNKEGLRIFSSLDLQLQRMAERALVEGLKKLEAAHPALRPKGEEDGLEGAIVVMRPQTGEIKAMVGGRNYGKSQFNRVFQAKRQPGSVFKPFVYLAALMHGGQSGTRYSPDTVINDSQFTWTYDRQEWQPHNYNNEYFGAVTVRRALESSLNSATARVAQDVGIRRVRDVARRLGIQSSLPAVPALALGAVEVTPLEVAVAFSTLANGGARTRPLAVKQVMDQNTKILERRDVKPEPVIGPEFAYAMNMLLKGVLDRGTGAMARRWGFTRPAAGKTGTTNDYKDAWFVGYTPDLLAVVWVGFDGPRKIGLSGAVPRLPIWTEFMKNATASMPVTDFVGPPIKLEPDEAPISKCGPFTREGEPPGEPCPPVPTPIKAPADPL